MEEVESPVNGKIRVIKSLGLGTYIQVDGLTQSGGVLRDIWKKVLKKVHQSPITVHRTLILGLGGGTAANLVRKYWPKSKITGVDVDEVFVNLGKKYLGLEKVNVEIKIEDGYQFVKRQTRGKKYDLVLIDMYIGYEVPKKFTTKEFVRSIKSLLTEDGVAVFNRLYHGDKTAIAEKFVKKLERVFSKVNPVYPEANVMFLCSQ